MDDSPFNKLSAEIRNQIYELVLFSNEPLSIDYGFAAQPPLTRVCKKMRSESLFMFYSLNTFSTSFKTMKLRTDGNSPFEAEFLDSTNNILAWINETPQDCHDAVKSLILTPSDANDPWYFFQHTWAENPLRRVRSILSFRGYGDDRVEVRVEVRDFRLSGYLFTNPINEREELERYMNRIGFNRVIIR